MFIAVQVTYIKKKTEFVPMRKRIANKIEVICKNPSNFMNENMKTTHQKP